MAETVYGTKTSLHKVKSKKRSLSPEPAEHPKQQTWVKDREFPTGRNTIVRLGVNVTALLGLPVDKQEGPSSIRPIFDDLKVDPTLQNACKQLCQEFPELFKKQNLGVSRTSNWRSSSSQTQNPSSAKHVLLLSPSRRPSAKPTLGLWGLLCHCKSATGTSPSSHATSRGSDAKVG